VWSPDSKRVAFQSDREGGLAIFAQSADGGTPERLTKPAEGEVHIPESWTPSGDYLLFSAIKGAAVTLQVLTLKDKTTTAFDGVRSTVPTSAMFSPDGRWVVYATSNAPSPQNPVYVQRFPTDGTKYQNSRGVEDGHHFVWSPDGKEISYIPRPGVLVAAPVTVGATVAVGNATEFQRRFSIDNAPGNVRSYDITRDGRPFIGIGGRRGQRP
jgi:Tol biopolymer transport system component